MFPLFMLLGLVAVAASSSDDTSSNSSSSGGGVAGDPIIDRIELTCDEAVAALPDVSRPLVAEAIMHGTDKEALGRLADQLEGYAHQAAATQYEAAAYLIVAHCVRARAAQLSTPMQTQLGAATFAPGPLSATGTAGASYAEAGGY